MKRARPDHSPFVAVISMSSVQGLLALIDRRSRHRSLGFEVMGPAGDNGLGSTFAMWAPAGPCRALPCAVARTHALQQTTCAEFRGTGFMEYWPSGSFTAA